jgi:hypothetical protein
MHRRRMIREPPAATRGEDGAELVALAPGELSGVFAAPSWLRVLGMPAWLPGGVDAGSRALGSPAVLLSFAASSLFFLLEDGPRIRGLRDDSG